ncbi:hypothetical protein [Parahaliea aestuarii]|uniref:Type II secretion system protein GspC N-terminal domain-containing protein n=1 Tax=Parahaliea aestuarii TaxID=1852021 RepID=A0A5C8ZNL9_9GAMM|nr:hypothetical protein [Parahaliea aestuarii]TXS90068.1 hypothetical protein FVW59_15820 [Parahaliea aestuarii]
MSGLNLRVIQSRYRGLSDPLLTERRLELAVLVVAAVLLLQLALTAADLLLPPNPDPVAPAADSLVVGSIEERARVNGEQSAAIRARPLFFPSRRPLEAEPVVAQQPEPEKKASTKRPDLKIVGVFGAGDMQGVIALHKNKLQRLYLDDNIEGWVLGKIEGGRATLNNNGDSWTVVLKRTDTGITAVSQPEPAAEAAGNQPDTGNAVQTTVPEEDGLVLGGRR